MGVGAGVVAAWLGVHLAVTGGAGLPMVLQHAVDLDLQPKSQEGKGVLSPKARSSTSRALNKRKSAEFPLSNGDRRNEREGGDFKPEALPGEALQFVHKRNVTNEVPRNLLRNFQNFRSLGGRTTCCISCKAGNAAILSASSSRPQSCPSRPLPSASVGPPRSEPPERSFRP